MASTELSDRLVPLAAALAAVQDSIATLRERETALKEQITSMVPGPDTYAAGALEVVVRQGTRIDLDAVTAKYPPAYHPSLYEMRPVAANIRANLPPDEVADLLKPTAATVLIR